MALDDLLKGLSGFQSGLQSLAQNMAIGDARQQLSEINAQVQDQNEKQAAAQQIGQDLALRLQQAKASPDQIASVTSGLIPSASSTQTVQAQSKMQQEGFQQADKMFDKEAALRLQLEQMKLDALGLKDAKKESQQYTKLSDTFRKENKELVGSWDKVSSLKQILQSTPDRVGVEMAKTGLLKFAGEDRVSDADVARAQRDPSLRAGIARRLKLEATGEALKDDQKFYSAILGHAETLMKEKLANKARGYAKGASELSGVDAKRLESGLFSQLGLEEAPASPPASTAIQKAREWLAKPENANHPKRAGVEANLKRWEAVK